MPELKARSVMSPVLKKVLNSEEVVVQTAPGVPANGAGGACFSRNGQSGEGYTSQQASSETRKHGTTNKHVNKKLAPSIRNADIT